MKNIKQIREEFKTILGLSESEESRLNALIETGLLESSKLNVVKRALMENRVLTPAEQKALISLTESLIAEVLINEEKDSIKKEKESVLKKEKESELKKDAKMSSVNMPSVITLTRKAVRVYPGKQNVGLYYSQQLNRYIAVPFGPDDASSVLSMSEETEQLDEISDRLVGRAYAKSKANADNPNTSSAERKKNAMRGANIGRMWGAKQAEKIASHKTRKGATAATTDATEKTKKIVNLADRYSRVVNNKRKEDNEKNDEPSFNPLKGHRRKKVVPKKGVDMNVPFKNKPKEPKPKDLVNRDQIEADKEFRGTGSVAGDIIKRTGQKYAAGHVIGSALYRALRPKAPTPVYKDQVDEGWVGDAVTAVKGGIQKFAGKLASSTGKSGNKDGSITGKEKESPFKKLRSDQQSKLKMSTSGIAADRQRRAQAQALAAKNREQVQEMIDVDLNGNHFQLNSSVANKILNVYQSLNEENRTKMIEKMNESEESLNKIISFALRQ